MPDANDDARIAERTALTFVATHPEIGTDGTFEIARDSIDAGLHTVVLQQTNNKQPVIGTQVLCVFGRDRLFAIESHALPNVHTPTNGTNILALNDDTFHAINMTADDHFDVYREHEHEILHIDRRLYNTGTLKFDIDEHYATDMRITAPAPHLDITMNNTATATDNDGTFSWTNSTTTIKPSMHGAIIDIINTNNNNTPITSLTIPNDDNTT